MTDLTDLSALTAGVNPFCRGTWHGKLRTFDDTDCTDFTKEDVAEVICAWDSGRDWDGSAAAVLLLKDGRFVSYETTWGPTGSGFSEDAYGGDADIIFSSTFLDAVRWGLTDRSREKMEGEIVEAVRRFYGDADATVYLLRRRRALIAAQARAAKPEYVAAREATRAAAEQAKADRRALLQQLNDLGREAQARLLAAGRAIRWRPQFFWTASRGGCRKVSAWHFHNRKSPVKVCVSHAWMTGARTARVHPIDPARLVAEVVANIEHGLGSSERSRIYRAEVIAILLGPADGTAYLEKAFSLSAAGPRVDPPAVVMAPSSYR